MFLLKLEKWLFYLLVFLLPLQLRLILYSSRNQFNEWTSVYLYTTDILLILIIFLWLVRELKDKKLAQLRKNFGKTEVMLGVFLLIGGFSLLVADNLKLSTYSLTKLIELSFLFLYLRYNFFRLYRLERFWQVFVASALIQSLVAIVQFFKQKSLGLKFLAESPLSPDIAGVAKIVVDGKNLIRAYGLVPHPNILAAILIVALFGLVFLFVKNYRRLAVYQKLIFILSFSLLFLALFLTFSRTVIIVGVGALFIWLTLLLRQKEFKKPALVAILFLVSGFLFLVLLMWPYVSARYDIVGLGKSQAVSLRVFYNRLTFDFIKGSPFLGIGQGAFVWTISSLGLFESWVYQPVHNIYLLIAAEIGVFGLFIFLWFLSLIIWNAYKSQGDKLSIYSLLFMVCSFLVIGFFDHFFWTLQQGQLMLWIMLGILASFGFRPHSSVGPVPDSPS